MCSVQTVQCVDTRHRSRGGPMCLQRGYAHTYTTPPADKGHAVTLSRCHAACAPWCCVTHLDHVGVSSVCCRLLQAPSWGHRPVATAAQADTRHAGERRHQTLHSGKLEHQRRLLKADVMLSDNRKWQKRLKSNSARAEVHQTAPTIARDVLSIYKNSKNRKLMSKKSLFHMKAHRAVQDTPLVLAPSLYSLCPRIVRRWPDAVHGDADGYLLAGRYLLVRYLIFTH